MAELFFKEEVYRIVGACFEVYKEKGHGFVESVYQGCLEMEMELQGIPCDSQRVLALEYKGRRLDQSFKPDLICFNQIIVEIKAVKELADEHRAQLLNYLKATGLKVGVLVNFGHHPGLQWERLVL
jgi:GxxExxY protein